LTVPTPSSDEAVPACRTTIFSVTAFLMIKQVRKANPNYTQFACPGGFLDGELTSKWPFLTLSLLLGANQ
jgi:hypothetical protein